MDSDPRPFETEERLPIVFDLDGTLAESTYPEPHVGRAITEMVNLARRYHNEDNREVIIHTARPESHKEEIWGWVYRHGLETVIYDVICGKPRAALYLDDRSSNPLHECGDAVQDEDAMKVIHVLLRQLGGEARIPKKDLVEVKWSLERQENYDKDHSFTLRAIEPEETAGNGRSSREARGQGGDSDVADQGRASSEAPAPTSTRATTSNLVYEGKDRVDPAEPQILDDWPVPMGESPL